MKQYTFDLEALTWGDIYAFFAAVEAQQVTPIWNTVMKCLPDAGTLPIREVPAVVQQFCAALARYFETANTNAATPDALRVLRGMFGERGPE